MSDVDSMLMSLTRRLLCSVARDGKSNESEPSGECAREIGVGVSGSMTRVGW